MKNIDTKDRKFLLISTLVTLTLIFFNIPLFLKSLAANKFATPEIKRLSNQVKVSELRKNEQQIWNKLKEINLDENDEDTKEAKAQIQLTSNQNNINSQNSQPYQKFLLLGDSTMYDLSPFINYDLRKLYHIKNVRLDYKVSTGLNRIDFYDWYEKTPEIIASYQPDVLAVIFGANDDQDILDSKGEYHTELSEEWKKTYRERVEKYAQLISNSSVKKIYWIGQPMSNIARYNKFYLVINEIYRDVVKKYPKIEFIDTWDIFAINGRFAPIIANKFGKKAYIRPRDGVHFTEHGSKILADLILDQMLKDKIITDKIIPQKQPPIKIEKTNQPYGRFLLIGDSTMSDLSPVINYDLRKLYHIKNVRLDYKVSTGLNRIDFYDWYAKTTDSIITYQPDVLIIIFGANDDQDILDDQGISHAKFTEEWQKIYRQRVEKYAKLISDSAVKKIYWIGQPISNRKTYNQFYPIVNEIYRDVLKNYPKIQFLETWDIFAINGQFAPILPNKLGKKAPVRLKDGVHFSEHGSRILGDFILDKMIKDQVITDKKITAPNSKPNQTNITKVEKVLQPYQRFLLIGDSIMYDLGTAINHNLRQSYHVNNVKLSYKVSTGLNRIDFYDWYAKTPELIKSYQPDVLIVMFGGNDDQDIVDSQGKYSIVLTEGWKKTYRERVERYAKLVSDSAVKKIYWIGHPISNVAHFNKFFPTINEVYKEVIENYPKIEFIETWNTFAVDGKFSPIIANKSGKKSYIRISDGVHFTEHGANILGDLIIDKMAEDNVIKANLK
jgi:uncharacterized protein